MIYNNDGNAAALYAHERHFGDEASKRSSVSAIVGTGLGGGVVEAGRVVRGAAGMAGELGHVQIPMDGLLVPGQPVPRCNCGFFADLESVASLSGIANNLLPFWLTRYPDHPLADVAVDIAAKQVRDYGERGDELAQHIFDQQAMAIGRMFTIAANFVDPDAYFIGGGVTDDRRRVPDRVRRARASGDSAPRRAGQGRRRSPSSPISTWPVPAAPRWRPCGQSDPRTQRPDSRPCCRCTWERQGQAPPHPPWVERASVHAIVARTSHASA